VCEVTDLVDLGGWPEGTRLIIRRQPKHPGTQTTLLPDLEYRFWGHYTDQKGDPAELDRLMRAHAHVEDFIGRLKDAGLERFPFTGFKANQAWLQTVLWASDLVGWFQEREVLTGGRLGSQPGTPGRSTPIRSVGRNLCRLSGFLLLVRVGV